MRGMQLGFSDCELTTAKKQTKREKFLSEMEVVLPLQALITLIELYYPSLPGKLTPLHPYHFFHQGA